MNNTIIIGVIGTKEEYNEFLEDNKKYPLPENIEYKSITSLQDCKDQEYHGLRFMKSCYLKEGGLIELAERLINRKPLKFNING